MTAKECITGRRSIRRFKPDAVSHELIAQIVETASFAPSWKNTQIARYTVIEGDLKNKFAAEATTPFPGNGKIIENAPALVVISVIKNRCGYERDGSFTTPRKDTWQMFDAGVAAQTFCLAAHENGLGTVILGIFDQDKVEELIALPEDREVVTLIPLGYADEEPACPRRKTVEDLLSFM